MVTMVRSKALALWAKPRLRDMLPWRHPITGQAQWWGRCIHTPHPRLQSSGLLPQLPLCCLHIRKALLVQWGYWEQWELVMDWQKAVPNPVASAATAAQSTATSHLLLFLPLSPALTLPPTMACSPFVLHHRPPPHHLPLPIPHIPLKVNPTHTTTTSPTSSHPCRPLSPSPRTAATHHPSLNSPLGLLHQPHRPPPRRHHPHPHTRSPIR